MILAISFTTFGIFAKRGSVELRASLDDGGALTLQWNDQLFQYEKKPSLMPRRLLIVQQLQY